MPSFMHPAFGRVMDPTDDAFDRGDETNREVAADKQLTAPGAQDGWVIDGNDGAVHEEPRACALEEGAIRANCAIRRLSERGGMIAMVGELYRGLSAPPNVRVRRSWYENPRQVPNFAPLFDAQPAHWRVDPTYSAAQWPRSPALPHDLYSISPVECRTIS